jgi:hypothetical protein
MESDDTKDLK